jgi:hypothetical protein
MAAPIKNTRDRRIRTVATVPGGTIVEASKVPPSGTMKPAVLHTHTAFQDITRWTAEVETPASSAIGVPGRGGRGCSQRGSGLVISVGRSAKRYNVQVWKGRCRNSIADQLADVRAQKRKRRWHAFGHTSGAMLSAARVTPLTSLRQVLPSTRPRTGCGLRRHSREWIRAALPPPAPPPRPRRRSSRAGNTPYRCRREPGGP